MKNFYKRMEEATKRQKKAAIGFSPISSHQPRRVLSCGDQLYGNNQNRNPYCGLQSFIKNFINQAKK